MHSQDLLISSLPGLHTHTQLHRITYTGLHKDYLHRVTTGLLAQGYTAITQGYTVHRDYTRILARGYTRHTQGSYRDYTGVLAQGYTGLLTETKGVLVHRITYTGLHKEYKQRRGEWNEIKNELFFIVLKPHPLL